MTALSTPRVPRPSTIGLHRRMSRLCDTAGHIRTMAFRIADSHSIAYDSAGDDSASAPPGGRRTVWHFRFTNPQFEDAFRATNRGF